MAKIVSRSIAITRSSSQNISLASDIDIGEVASRIIWVLAGVVVVILAFRFFATLIGANPNAWFVHSIYDASQPFVTPFIKLFHGEANLGFAKLDIFTLLAMALYSALAYGAEKVLIIRKMAG